MLPRSWTISAHNLSSNGSVRIFFFCLIYLTLIFSNGSKKKDRLKEVFDTRILPLRIPLV